MKTNCKIKISLFFLVNFLAILTCAGSGFDIDTRETVVTSLNPNYVLESLVVSTDNLHVVYVSSTSSSMWLVEDGQEDASYESILINSLTYSPDCKRLACIAKQIGGWVVIVDRRPGSNFSNVLENSLSFSPDSRHLAYFAKDFEQWVVVVDDVVSDKKYAVIPKGSRIVWDSNHSLHFVAVDRSGNVFMVTQILKTK